MRHLVHVTRKFAVRAAGGSPDWTAPDHQADHGGRRARLIDDGLLELDRPVDALLPELADRRVLRSPDGPLEGTVPAERPITTRDLLTVT